MDELRRVHALLSTDPTCAVEGLETLAARGSVMSMLYLQEAYRKGTGVGADMQQAGNWMRRAAAAGSVLASYELGRSCAHKKDYLSAREHYLAGVAKEYPPSMSALAVMYIYGKGVPVDLDKARALLEVAVTKGHILAKGHLGALLIKGRFGVRQIPKGILMFLSGFVDIFRLPSEGQSERFY